MNLDIGSNVLTSDGKSVGKVDRIIYQSDTKVMREFVVHKGPFFATDRIVHRELVDEIDDDHVVRLRITADEADELPPFVKEQHFAIYGGSSLYIEQPTIMTKLGSAPRDAVVLSHRSKVYDSVGKQIGHLDEVVYEADGVATAFVVDAGFIFTHDVRVPLEAVRRVSHDRIELNLTSDEAEMATGDGRRTQRPTADVGNGDR